MQTTPPPVSTARRNITIVEKELVDIDTREEVSVSSVKSVTRLALPVAADARIAKFRAKQKKRDAGSAKQRAILQVQEGQRAVAREAAVNRARAAAEKKRKVQASKVLGQKGYQSTTSAPSRAAPAAAKKRGGTTWVKGKLKWEKV